MAFIPDDALDRYDELPPAAQLGYNFFCRYRNHRTGIAPKSFEDCAVKHNWSRATKFLVQKILTEKKWVEKVEHGYRPLVGDFSPVNKSKNLDYDSQQSKFLDSKNIESLKNQTKKSKNLDSPLKDNQLRNQLSQDSEESFEREREDAPAPATEFPPELMSDFFAMHKIMFPEVDLDGFQKNIIKNRIRDGTIWAKVLTNWRGNKNLGKSIATMCDAYDELILKEKKQNGAGQKQSGKSGIGSTGAGKSGAANADNNEHLKPRGIGDKKGKNL